MSQFHRQPLCSFTSETIKSISFKLAQLSSCRSESGNYKLGHFFMDKRGSISDRAFLLNKMFTFAPTMFAPTYGPEGWRVISNYKVRFTTAFHLLI